MANNTLIGALRVEASLDTAKFVDGAKKIQKESKQTEATVKSSFSGIGAAAKAGIAGFAAAFTIGALTAGIKAALDYAASLKTLSQQAGVTARDFQELRFAAGQTGVGQRELEQGLERMNTSLSKAADGSKAARKAFADVGVSIDDIAKKSNRQIFEQIAEGMKNQGGAARNAAAATTIFGESAANLTPLLDQGSEGINNLANAAQELGIVLSDEQIRKADETANKLEALKTVLSARIAGVVADNADAILLIAEALAAVVNAAAAAVNAMQMFYAILAGDGSGRGAKAGSTAGSFAGSLLGGAGGGRKISPIKGSGRRRARRGGRGPRDRSDDVAAQVERELLQADMDILRAKQQVAADYIERASLSIAMLDLERQMFQLEQADKVRRAERDFAEKKIDEATLQQVKAGSEAASAKFDQADALRRQAVIDEEAAEREGDVAQLINVSFDLQEDALRDQLVLTRTAKERRELELRLLDLARQREQAAIDELAASKDIADQEEARRRQVALNSSYAGQRQQVINGTRGPLEEWAASVPQTAQEITEAFQSIQANGLENLSDALTDVIMGTRDLKDAFRALAADIIAQTIQMIIKMLIFRALTSAFGGASFGGGSVPTGAGIPGFATGGSFMIGGLGGTDRNVLSLNGLPIARVSKGETVGISSQGFDNGDMPQPVSLTNYNDFRGADPSAVAAITARLNQMETDLPNNVVRVVKNARERFMTRG